MLELTEEMEARLRTYRMSPVEAMKLGGIISTARGEIASKDGMPEVVISMDDKTFAFVENETANIQAFDDIDEFRAALIAYANRNVEDAE